MTGVYFAGSLLFFSGCGSEDGGYKPVDTATNKTADTLDTHQHERGPHDGHIIELGHHEYHAELTYVPIQRKVGVYLLGPDSKTALPVDARTLTLNLMVKEKPAPPLTLNAKPLESEKGGKSSYFEAVGTLDQLKDAKSIEALEGELVVDINGKSYRGKVGHDHEHGDHDEHDHAEGDKHDEKAGDKDHEHKEGDKDHEHKEAETKQTK
jgi:hypothetical protein